MSTRFSFGGDENGYQLEKNQWLHNIVGVHAAELQI